MSKIYLIRHNHDNSYALGNLSFWYDRYFATSEEAVGYMLDKNSDNLTTLTDEDGEPINENLYRCENVILGGEAWSVGDTSLDMGDWTESVHEVECENPGELVTYLYYRRTTASCNLDAVVADLESILN